MDAQEGGKTVESALAEIVERTMEFAKQVMSNNAKHALAPMAICMSDDGRNSVIPCKFSEAEKYTFYQTVGMICRKERFDRVILINDGAMRQVQNDKDMDFIKANYDTESPLSYPKSMRKECIIVLGHDFKTRQTSTVIQPYKETEAGPDYEKMEHVPMVDSALVDSVREGYNA